MLRHHWAREGEERGSAGAIAHLCRVDAARRVGHVAAQVVQDATGNGGVAHVACNSMACTVLMSRAGLPMCLPRRRQRPRRQAAAAAGSTCLLEGCQVGAGQLRVVIRHLLKVGHMPVPARPGVQHQQGGQLHNPPNCMLTAWMAAHTQASTRWQCSQAQARTRPRYIGGSRRPGGRGCRPPPCDPGWSAPWPPAERRARR